jgi:hypothetical protein
MMDTLQTSRTNPGEIIYKLEIAWGYDGNVTKKRGMPQTDLFFIRSLSSKIRIETNWLVVSTPLRNISQWEGLSTIIPYIMEK